MSSRRSRLAVSAAAILVAGLASAPALAAEAVALPELPSLEPEEPIAASGGGLYVRGWAGLGLGDRAAGKALPLTYVTAPGGRLRAPDAAIAKARIDGGWSAGAGVGYRIGPMFRVDVTGEYMSPAAFRGVGVDAGFAAGAGGSVGLYRAKVRSRVALANVYWDIVTWQGFTPYVGAGLGAAWTRMEKVSRVEQAQPFAPATDALVARHGDQTRLAFALHAGVGYDLAPGLHADLAYRYLNVGGASSGRAVCDGAGCHAAAPLRVKDMASHAVTLGLRWELGSR